MKLWFERSLLYPHAATTVRGKRVLVFRERAGVISKDPCWVCVSGDHLYVEDTLRALIRTVLTEWEEDRHLA